MHFVQTALHFNDLLYYLLIIFSRQEILRVDVGGNKKVNEIFYLLSNSV